MTQTASRLKEIIYLFGTKLFWGKYTEIYRHLLSKYFENGVFGRQEMLQCKCFFWHQTERCLLENLESQKGFWLCCGSISFSMSSELRFRRSVRLFERNCIVKWVIFFASFCWFWDFLLEYLKIKKQLWWCPLERVDDYKNVVFPK